MNGAASPPIQDEKAEHRRRRYKAGQYSAVRIFAFTRSLVREVWKVFCAKAILLPSWKSSRYPLIFFWSAAGIAGGSASAGRGADCAVQLRPACVGHSMRRSHPGHGRFDREVRYWTPGVTMLKLATASIICCFTGIGNFAA